MVLTITMLMVRKPKSAQTRSTELPRGPFCATVCPEREYGIENLRGARLGLVLDNCSGRARRWC
eukprot:13802281-Alexandrium_andersonii.AAC.1